MIDSHLQLPENASCSFCDYLTGARPFTILCRGELVATLVTREQRGIGHLLVVTVRHTPTLLETTPEERHALIDALEAAASAINETYERPGIAIWQNNGEPAHQAIAHMHFHVAGTLPGGGTEFGEVPELSLSQTDAIAQTILTSSQRDLCS